MTAHIPNSPAASPPRTSQRWRLALGIERISCALFDQFEGSSRVVFFARFSGPMDERAVRQALTAVTAACPRANLLIQALPSGDYEFRTQSPAPPVSITVRSVTDADDGAMVAAEIAQESFAAGEEPVLRWVVLPSECDETFQVAAVAHHGLFDAASIVILLRRFLQVLGESEIPAWEWPEPTLPAARWNTSWRHWTGMFQHIARHWPVLKRCQGMPREEVATGTCVIHRWTSAETERLTQACRQAGTTVTALLGVAGMFAVRSHYGEALPQVNLAVPINPRRFLPAHIADQTLGTLIVLKNFAIDFCKPVSFQEQSRQIAARLKWFVQYEGPLRLYRTINLLTPRRLILRRQQPVCVSANSLGCLDQAPSPSGVRWLECGWLANGGPHIAAFAQAAATVDNCLAITSYSRWIAGSRLRDLAADVDARLRQFAGVAPAEIDEPTSVPDITPAANSVAVM